MTLGRRLPGIVLVTRARRHLQTLPRMKLFRGPCNPAGQRLHTPSTVRWVLWLSSTHRSFPTALCPGAFK